MKGEKKNGCTQTNDDSRTVYLLPTEHEELECITFQSIDFVGKLNYHVKTEDLNNDHHVELERNNHGS